MPPPRIDFEDYLAGDEDVVIEGVPGTLIDGSRRLEGAIGVTDRRLLFRSTGDWFMDVSHDAVESIQSHPRSSPTSRDLGYRALVAIGALVAVGAVVGVASVGSDRLAALTFLVIGGTVGGIYVRRAGVETVWLVPDAVAGRLHVLGRRGPVRRVVRRARVGRGWNPLAVGFGAIAVGAAGWLMAIVGSLTVLVFPIIGLFGLAMVDHGIRQRRVLETLGADRRYERALRIHLTNGRQLQLVVDPERRIDRELSGAVRTAERSPTAPELAGA